MYLFKFLYILYFFVLSQKKRFCKCAFLLLPAPCEKNVCWRYSCVLSIKYCGIIPVAVFTSHKSLCSFLLSCVCTTRLV